MLAPGHALHALENQWRERVEQTFREYEAALDRLKVLPLHSDLRQRASQKASQALDRYMRELGIFTDLVLRRQIPPE